MSTNTVHSAPNLEYYRKQAKALLKAVSANDSTALSRVRSHLPLLNKPLRLADAQWVLAREYGFPSWPKFKYHLESALPTVFDPVPEPESAPPLLVTPLKPGRGAAISTDAVFAKTGRHWREWFELFDVAGCATMNHQQIVAITREHGAEPWWQQMVAVQYERARGLRDTNMNCDGEYNVGVSKTLAASVHEVFDAWMDPSLRDRWLPGAQLTIRKAVPDKRILITWAEGGSVTVNLTAKPDGRCLCTAEHSKLTASDEVERCRAFWSAALERLQAMLKEEESKTVQ